jgi:hypothetical protein
MEAVKILECVLRSVTVTRRGTRAGAAMMVRLIPCRTLGVAAAHLAAECQAGGADVFPAMPGVNGGAPLP